jgi:hypothetical protein
VKEVAAARSSSFPPPRSIDAPAAVPDTYRYYRDGSLLRAANRDATVRLQA